MEELTDTCFAILGSPPASDLLNIGTALGGFEIEGLLPGESSECCVSILAHDDGMWVRLLPSHLTPSKTGFREASGRPAWVGVACTPEITV